MWSFCGWWGVGCSFCIRFLETRILYNICRICYRTLLNINNSGFNQLVRTKSLESAIISFGIPSFKPCPSPCQLTENSERLMECSFGNVSDQVWRQNGLLHNGIELQRSSCTLWLPTAFHGGSSSSLLGSASSSCSSSPTFSRTSSTKDSGWDFPCLQLQPRCRLFLLQMSSTTIRTVT